VTGKEYKDDINKKLELQKQAKKPQVNFIS
jgi:hypothetical protein